MKIKLTEAELADALERAQAIDAVRGLRVGDRVSHVRDCLINAPLVRIEKHYGLINIDGQLKRYPLSELTTTETQAAVVTIMQMLKFMKRKKRKKGVTFVFQF